MGINQVLVRNDVGMTFAAALKAFLRQDPTSSWWARSAIWRPDRSPIKAALTGHLVLSTLHTNDAPSTVTRMIDMGIEPFNVASGGEPDRGAAAGAAHLSECKQEHKYSDEEIHAFGIPPRKPRS